MQFAKSLVAAAAVLVSVGASAMPTTTVGLSGTSFLTLTAGGTTPNSGGTFSGAATGTILGGQILTTDTATGDKDSFGPVTNYLSAGPTAGSPALFTLNGAGSNFLSFMWGSPDTYNGLTVTTTAGSFSYTAAGLGLPTGGSQATGSAKFVAFQTTGMELIKSLTFTSSADAFEAANFSVTAVPEPETYALMLAGLGVLGFVARRRKPV